MNIQMAEQKLREATQAADLLNRQDEECPSSRYDPYVRALEALIESERLIIKESQGDNNPLILACLKRGQQSIEAILIKYQNERADFIGLPVERAL